MSAPNDATGLLPLEPGASLLGLAPNENAPPGLAAAAAPLGALNEKPDLLVVLLAAVLVAGLVVAVLDEDDTVVVADGVAVAAVVALVAAFG